MSPVRRSGWSFTPLDILLVAIPVAIALRYVPGWNNGTAIFIIAAVAIVPLAGWMGRATEQLAARSGSGVGGLLNATFGNAAELIIALVALSKGLTGVVKASLTGSIIGNLLLVLGASILVGGIRFPKQTFNQTAARISSTSLGLGAIALLIPTIFHRAAAVRPGGWTIEAEQRLSFAIVIVLFVTYFCSLLFHLVTHRDLFAGNGEHEPAAEKLWPLWQSLSALAIATTLVAWLSELLVGSIESARHALGLTEMFVGVVVVAINFFAVEQPVDIKEIQIEAENIASLLDDGEFEPTVTEIGVTFMNNIPFVVVQEFSPVHRHDDLRQMTCLIKIKWKSSGNIA